MKVEELLKEEGNLLEIIPFSPDYMAYKVQRQVTHFPCETSKVYMEYFRLPSFVHNFYDFIKKRREPPLQEEFWEYYFSIAYPFLQAHGHEGNVLDIKERIYRAYPSLVRDLHTALVLRELGAFNDVVYNTRLDMIYKFDVLIRNKGRDYGIRLMTMTKFGVKTKGWKLKNQQQSLEGVVAIDMLMELPYATPTELVLYSNESINHLVRIIGGEHYGKDTNRHFAVAAGHKSNGSKGGSQGVGLNQACCERTI